MTKTDVYFYQSLREHYSRGGFSVVFILENSFKVYRAYKGFAGQWTFYERLPYCNISSEYHLRNFSRLVSILLRERDRFFGDQEGEVYIGEKVSKHYGLGKSLKKMGL